MKRLLFFLCLSLWGNFILSSDTANALPTSSTTMEKNAFKNAFYFERQDQFRREMDKLDGFFKHEKDKLDKNVEQFIFVYGPLYSRMNWLLVSIDNINDQAVKLMEKHTGQVDVIGTLRSIVRDNVQSKNDIIHYRAMIDDNWQALLKNIQDLFDYIQNNPLNFEKSLVDEHYRSYHSIPDKSSSSLSNTVVEVPIKDLLSLEYPFEMIKERLLGVDKELQHCNKVMQDIEKSKKK